MQKCVLNQMNCSLLTFSFWYPLLLSSIINRDIAETRSWLVVNHDQDLCCLQKLKK